MENTVMSSLALLVAVLLVLVTVMFVGALLYLGHHHPKLIAPLTLALVGAAFVAALVVPVVIS
ncbi:hypothetical protein [Streptomyces luridiscabiei]|uniref:hypothetical protein n=1 Tax=Streptomyces luridiscabiei TaxID=164114 RepID=UPI0006E333D3|nr:hypothetical protein [Streptomyces luridiscabiei]